MRVRGCAGRAQVPQTVVDAIADYLSNWNATSAGRSPRGRSNKAVLAAHAAAAAFLGCDAARRW